MDNYQPGDMLHSDNPKEFWNTKLEDTKTTKVSEDKTLFEDIAERGQQKPILIGSRGMGMSSILDGHHRLAALHHINPDQFVKYRLSRR